MHVQSATHVMIAGSRYATREMLDYARRAVQRAHEKGYIVLVGDNSNGVDTTQERLVSNIVCEDKK